jgi:DNA-binding CsgD family transcriptional regulator
MLRGEREIELVWWSDLHTLREIIYQLDAKIEQG